MTAKKLVFVAVLVVLVYGAILLWGDVGKLRLVLSGYRWWTFFLALALAFTNYLLRFLKWQYYLKLLGITGVPWWESLAIHLSGFVMSITPAKAGEVFKSGLLLRSRGVPIARSAPIVVADRLTDLTSLILIVGVGGLYFPGGTLPALAALGLVGGIMAFVLVRPLGELALSLVGRVSIGARLAPKLRTAYDALRILASPAALLWPTFLSVVAWGCECLGLWVILRGVGHAVSPAVAFFVYSTATIAGAVAMLPGGVGGTEGMMIALLRALAADVPEAHATAATLLVRLATLWFAVLVGVVALLCFNRWAGRAKAIAA
ncbi:MAG: flippase-like domain-containing protein [Deltaproteobacteria bacterium]|nr:flippase-like domain-containing protein [Deltaproteobacteria bacterium]